MLKKILIAMLAALMIFAVACKKQPDDTVVPDDNPPVSGDEGQTQDDESNPYNAEDVKEFIAEKYAAAKEAYLWFLVTTMPPAEGNADMNNIKEIDGMYYYKTGTENINSVAALEAYLKTLFANDLAQEIMALNQGRYIDIDGELWACDTARGSNIYVGESMFVITEKDDSKIVYTANVEEIDPEIDEVVGMNSYENVYEKTDDGWRWTKFVIYE